ncbi:MAG TPA: CDP-diacylglycerol--glycerol-3-phosphate 3-phosphatidyltransferase [Geminicoccaceae bacterium]|nr:CDP-diacylglycerol--glycerol-3-phosphate 3-phosphatidyltransferase [Geminicoccaceae bacterium]
MLTKAPNLLTGARVLAVPAMVAAFYIPGAFGKWVTCAIFAVAAVTDYFDGYLARSWSMQSPFGRMLDPIADKLLVGAAILMLVHFDRAPILPALIILCREILVSGLREFLAEAQVGLPVSRLAKWKTSVQMVAIGFLIAGTAAPWWLYADSIGTYGLWLAAGLTLVTGFDYLMVGLRHSTAAAPEIKAGGTRPAAVPVAGTARTVRGP